VIGPSIRGICVALENSILQHRPSLLGVYPNATDGDASEAERIKVRFFKGADWRYMSLVRTVAAATERTAVRDRFSDRRPSCAAARKLIAEPLDPARTDARPF
jgi:hypothetical protein